MDGANDNQFGPVALVGDATLLSQLDVLGILHALCEPDLGERAADEIAGAHQVPMEHGTGAA